MGVNRSSNYVADDLELEFDVDAAPAAASSTAVGTGWDDAVKSNAPTGEGFPTELKLSEQFQLIKFIDTNGPFAVYSQHFLQQKTEGKRSFVCVGANCPLCTKLQHRPEKKTAFSVVKIVDGMVQKQMLIATPRLYKTLHAAEFSPQGPLTKNFWAINRTGKMQQTVYNLMSVKARDLVEDWGDALGSLTIEEIDLALADIKPFERSIIKDSTYAELLDLAEQFA